MRVALVMVLLAGAALAQAGCATVFTGTSREVEFASVPPGANVVVLGGPAGDSLLKAKKGSDVVKVVARILRAAAPADYHAAIDKLSLLDVETFVTLVVPWVEVGQMPPELGPLVPLDFPKPTARAVLSALGVEAWGQTPFAESIGKGKEYAVLVWKKGHRARVIAMEKSFNFLFLLNILNVFLLSPIDIASGAWYSVGPGRIDVVLEPLPPGPAPD